MSNYDYNKKYVKKYLDKFEDMKIRVPKGRKADIEAHAKQKGKSYNGLVNDLLREDMGISEENWKKSPEV